MSTLAVAVPAVPAIAWALLALAEAVTFVVCLGLLWSWKRTIGRAFVWLGNKAISASIHGAGFSVRPFGFLLSLNESVIEYLGQAVAATEHAMVYSFQRMVGVIVWTGQEIAGLATDTYNAIAGSASAVTTTVTKTLDAKTTALVNKLKTSVATLTNVTIPNLRARVKALEHRVVRTAHATAGAIAAPFPRIGHLEKTVKAQGKRLTKVEKALALGASAALVLTALKRLGLGWLRCNNVGKAGKAVCGMNPSLLEALLLDAATLTLAFNLEDFAEEMQSVTREAADLIHNWAT